VADDPDDVGVLTATDAPVPAPSLRPAEPGEGSQAAEAAAARATIARLPRRRVAPPVQATPSTQTEPVAPGGNFFSQFRNDPPDDGVELAERNRLNRQDGFYRGSLAGSMRLSALAHIYETPDGPDVTPERKAVNDEMRAEYQRVVADLAKHDMIPGFGSTAEALVAFAGQLEGTMISPESWIGWGAKGATWLARTLSAAGQQAVIQGVTDPVIQAANIGAGVKDQYDPVQTVLSMGLGGVIGAGGHQVGEIGGRLMTRRMLADLGKMDSAYVNSVIADEMGALERGVVPRTDAVPAEAPVARQYEPGPPTSFNDVVAGIQEGYGLQGAKYKEEARFAAFREEVGADIDGLLKRYDLDEPVGVELSKYYDRAPGENPKAALERALDEWYADVEAKAIKLSDIDTPDSRLKADWDEAQRIQENYDRWNASQPFTYQEGKLASFGQGTERTLQGMSPTAGLTGRAPNDVPFESGGTAAKGGDFPEGRVPEPGKEGGPAGGGEVGATGGGRGGERLGAQAAAIGTERLGGPALTTERTAQGEQTLIPGVEPITDRQRLEAEGAKPLRGGNAAPGGMFDTDARAQGDLLGRKIPDDVQGIAQRKKGGRMEGETVRPDDGISGAPSPEKDLAVRSLQQMSFDLAKALDFPLRQGRVQSRDLSGQFSPRTGVVRVREVPDFEVVSHEAGHALEAKIGKELTDLTERFETELAPMDYEKDKARVNEGFAEWVRLFLNNPAYAERQAPGFTTAFRAFMQKEHPDLLTALDATAANKIAYDKASSVDAVGAVVRSYNEDEHVVKETLAALKKKEMPPVIKAFMHESYTALFDKYAPMTQAIREMAIAIRDKSGVPVDLKAAYNPEKMIRLLDRSRQGAVDAMQYGVTPRDSVTPDGPSLTDALVLATGQTSAWGAWDPVRLRDFDTYLIARRAVDLWRRFDAGELANPPVAFSPGDAAMAVRELEAAFPTFKDAGEMVQGYARQILRKKFESGLLKADSYQAILDTDGFYVPFYRDRRDLPGSGGSGTGGAMEGGPGLVDATHRIKGSSRDIYSPVESLMRDTFLMEHQVRLNDIVNALGQFGERAGVAGGKYIERIPAFEARKHVVPLGEILENKVREMGMTKAEGDAFLASMGDLAREDPLMGSFFKMEQTSGKGEPIVFSKQGGELVAWRVMSEKEGYPLYELLTAAPDAISDVWVQLIGTAAGIKRAGITTNPVFALSNYIRDQFAAAILRSDYIPILSGLRGMADEINQAPAARQYAAAGGVSGGAATGPIDRAVELEIDALRKRGFAVQRFTSFKGLLELASFTEAGTRNSIVAKVYETKKSQGLSDVEALAEAVKEAQDIMDFSRHGSRTLAITKMIPFLNATAQGLDKARRTMIEPLWQRMRDGQVFAEDSDTFKNALMAWAKMGGLGAATGAAWAAINWEKEAYRDASVKFKATHIVVPYGNKIVVVPKPFELGLGFTLGEYAFARLMKDDQRAGGQFMEAAWDVLKLPLQDIPLVTSGTELALGKSLFTGRDIVPSALQGLPSEMQFTDRTSEAAKWLGQQTGMSPIKIEYFVGSQFGNWGRDALALSQGVGEDAPAKDFDDRIFLRRFVKDPTRSSDAVTKFWDFMGRTTGKYNQSLGAYDTLVKGFQEQKAAEFLSKLPAAEKSFVTLRSAADENGKPAFSADEKRLHPLQRAYDAVTIVNGMRKEMATNNFATYEGGARVKLDPEMRRDLLDNIRELGQMEMRNALVALGEPGYVGRPILDVNDVMLKIRHLSPEVANELATRYATAKIYKTEEVVKVWPRAQRDLSRFGSGADIQGLSYEAKGAGYEFGGERVRKPAKRRVSIEGSP